MVASSTEPQGKALHYSVSTPENSPSPDVIGSSKSTESPTGNDAAKSKLPFTLTNPLKKLTSKPDEQKKGLPGAGEQPPPSGFHPSASDTDRDTQMLVEQDDDQL